ncbi:acyl-CoA dehydrogenase [Mycolicibacterium psychrotolerans]|uniref:Acyl-CoA dehydrogenase n=1 Tax=Mycolicibacterium psychrotolerans TaxID=216929 RepID=A0A7I7MD28_9MYCO|nr:acyl-CoA dehydrogenase [Mycolicibacterium psychrotolerans]BBX69423.1 acyl-CoA dehydrogenase [Mycolicibacterium psychrotolerans]
MSAPHIEPALADMMDAVFAEHGQDADLWSRLDDLGLVRLTGAEDAGGSGAGWLEAAELVSAAARHGARIPLAEHDLLACWLLDTAGVPADSARRTVCLLDAQGRAAGVPWASSAQRVVAVWQRGDDHVVADLDPAGLSITAGANMIGEPRDTVVADLAILSGATVTAGQIATLRLKAALIRAVQICAALDRALELSIEHATTREQFGRTLSKFQAVQHLISDIACEAALARSATEAALSAAIASDWSAPNLEFLVASARSCAGHATSVVVRNAHQVLGAIGTTSEHRLHVFTRAALAWRSEFGSMRHWDDLLTDMALHAGPDGLWALIAP